MSYGQRSRLMVKIKIFCMQKDEDDILEDWIRYHSYLFGIDNLYIVDNYSGQFSLEILRKYEKRGLYWIQKPDYSKKGDYLYELMKQFDCDLAIPLDIDEFIAFVDEKNIPAQYLMSLAQACLSLDCQYYINRYPQVQTEAKTPSEIYTHFITKGFHFGWTPCLPKQLKNITSLDCQQS
jgi:hypothetical protein